MPSAAQRGRRTTSGASTAVVASAALQAHRAALLRLGAASGCAEPRAPPGPSLAQRLGLVPGPPPPLTPAQWLEVHLQSQARQDSCSDCAICLRPFRGEGQVLLSCSHTYHDRCLASLERFARQAGGGAAPTCPLCRAAAYEKRRIDDAQRLWRHSCAARIQAAWRGLQARRAYRAVRRLLPPQHPALRRRWAAEALGDAAAPLVAGVESGAAEVDALFAELDATAAAAGTVFQQLSARCPVSVPAGPSGGSPQPSTAANSRTGITAGRRDENGADAGQPSGPAPVQQHDWETAIARCLERDEQPECAICLAPLGQLCSGHGGGSKGSSGKGGRPKANQAQRPAGVAVLSCSHAYHADCLSAFEAFAVSSDLSAACPCCRSAYARLDLC
ncbi:hypothetical protein ABPG75_003251 [Micractinium tetrahymenae]